MTFSTIPDLVCRQQRHPSPGSCLQRRSAAVPPHSPGRQRRESQGPRHPGRDPHAPGHRAGPAARHPRGARRCSPASPASARWPWGSFPTRSPAATRTRPGRRWARSCGRSSRPRSTPAPSAPPSPPSTPRRSSSGRCTTALARLGVPRDATVLEPGCGIGNFMALAPAGMRFIGVELDRLSGRIARALLPRPRHPHRKLPRHAPARGPHRRRHRQRALRRPPARLPRDAPRPARLLPRQVPRRPEAWRRAGPGDQPLHARQAERRRCGSISRSRPISWAPSACPPTPSSRKARAS